MGDYAKMPDNNDSHFAAYGHFDKGVLIESGTIVKVKGVLSIQSKELANLDIEVVGAEGDGDV
jgi:hypothetical protein